MRLSTTGERIKQCRLKLGMTQTELAEKIGVKFSAIHKYENGLVVNLKRETIEKLAIALNVRPSYLMCMDDDPSPLTSTTESSDDEDLAEYLEELRRRPEAKILLESSRGMTVEQVKSIVAMIENFRNNS
jgi:transcriptional regulator with XRE-family HTH domain